MSIFKISTFFFILFALTFGTGCNTKDTGISKPIPDCFDGIQNQGELGVDCGGPCSAPCPSKMSANIDGTSWESQGAVTGSVASGQLRIDGGSGQIALSLIHQGPFETGTYNLHQALYQNYNTGTMYFSDQGTITFTSWDASEKLVSGTFSFTAWQMSGGTDTVIVNQGKFDFVGY